MILMKMSIKFLFQELGGENIKARIYHPCKNGLYWGQVYNEKFKYWENVTLSCFTEMGAKRKLNKWRKRNRPEEFEI